jgi:HK97 gp10 family phage protein
MASNGFTFDLQGLNKALADMYKYSAYVKEEVNLELTATVNEAADLAKQLAPVDDGALRNGIVAGGSVNEKATLASNAAYSGFQEFGTGGNVSIPEFAEGLTDLAAYAEQFRGAGLPGYHPVKFKDGSWRMVPNQLNLPARPFFFPAIQSATLEMISRLQKILANE